MEDKTFYTKDSAATVCQDYGSIAGCNVDCPVLIAGLCEFQDDENKELYEEAMELYRNDTGRKTVIT